MKHFKMPNIFMVYTLKRGSYEGIKNNILLSFNYLKLLSMLTGVCVLPYTCVLFLHHRSFGVSLWEVITFGNLPYADLSNEHVLRLVIKEKTLTLTKPDVNVTHLDRL